MVACPPPGRNPDANISATTVGGEAAPAERLAEAHTSNGHAANGHGEPPVNAPGLCHQGTPPTSTKNGEGAPLTYKDYLPDAARAIAEIAPLLRAIFAPDDRVLTRHVEIWTEPHPKTGMPRKRTKVYYHATRYAPSKSLLSDTTFVAHTLWYSARFNTNVFFGTCPRVGPKRFNLAWQIRTIRVLWADLDYVTVEEALRKCAEAGLPKPSAVVRSGNGVHLYWLLAEPVLINDAPPPLPAYLEFDPEKKNQPRHYIIDPKTKDKVFDLPELSPQAKRVQDVLVGMAVRLDGDHTQDLSRLLRLPGTMNRKDGRNGRQPLPCALVECDAGRRYPFADFERFAQFAEQATATTRRTRSGPSRKVPVKGKTATKFEELLADVANEQMDRSKAEFNLIAFAIRKNLDKEAVWSRMEGIGKVADRGRVYFDKTWDKAEAEVEKNGGRRPTITELLGGSRPDQQPETSSPGGGSGLPPNDQPTGGAPPAPTGGDTNTFRRAQLPRIGASDLQLREMAQAAMSALVRANNPPIVFQRGGSLVRLKVDARTQEASIQELKDAALRGRLTRVADWFTINRDGDLAPAPPPRDVVQDLQSWPEWPDIPLLDAVVETPVFGCHSRLVATPGYDAEAFLLYRPRPGFEVPPVSEKPTKDEIRRAKLWILDELLGDFPFVGDADKANALAATLLPLVRHMINGPTPLHLFDAPMEGTGKTLLVESILVIATTQEVRAMAADVSDDEMRKRILATLLRGPTFVFLDNINKTLDSASLASALTSLVYEDRVLGESRTASAPNTAVWIASGNNVRMSRELIRRTIWSRIDRKSEAPHELPQETFRHQLPGWAKENRAQLVWAALTLCQAWIAADKPRGKQTLGKFEEWAAVMGGILDVAEVPGLMGNVQEFRAAATDKSDEWRGFVTEWWARHAEAEVSPADLFKLVSDRQLLEQVRGSGSWQSQKVTLGIAINKMRDRVIGKYRIRITDKDHSGRNVYRLEELAQPAKPEKPAQPPKGDAGQGWEVSA